MRLPERRQYSMGCLKKSFSLVYDLGKQIFGHPSHIDDVPCNLCKFCYSIEEPYIRHGKCGFPTGAWTGAGTADNILRGTYYFL